MSGVGEIAFSNYNNAFYYFFEEYKNLCVSISESKNIYTIYDNMYAFIYDFDYAVVELNRRNDLRQKIKNIKSEINNDKQLQKILSKDYTNSAIQVEYIKYYYKYLLDLLNVLGEFATELTDSYLPHTNIKHKSIRYFNNQPFFDKFIELKRLNSRAITTFSIFEFISKFNTVLTFYSAYKVFISQEDILIVDQGFKIIIEMMTHKDTVYLLSNYKSLSAENKKKLHDIESLVQNMLNEINSKINASFSNFGILPKIIERKYEDDTLI